MTALLLILFGFAIIDWIAVAIGNHRLEYFAKPATLLILILWFSIQLPDLPPLFSVWFFFGLILSLIGDIFLMLPEENFIKGLIAFLLSHITYIIAFNLTGLIMNLESLLIATAVALVTWIILRRIVDSMRVSGRSSLITPVIFYGAVLSLMLWSAVTRVLHSDWEPLAGWLTALGGALFYFADASNAWNRFVGQLPGGRLFEMITYHLAQLILSLGMLLVINDVI
jgi:uncharacterized membrane protein YhhN